MNRGRKPTPTRIKLLTGNPGCRPINTAEPQFDLGAEPPAWLDDYGREEWFVVAAQLNALGMLPVTDTAALAAYCQTVSHLRHTQDDLAAATDGKERLGLRRQFVQIANALRAAASEFGFTPASRARVRVPGAEKDQLDEFLSDEAAAG